MTAAAGRSRRTPGAVKARAHRQRRAQGLTVLRLTVPEYEIVSYLLETERLSPVEALSRFAVERAASDALVDLARYWRKKRNW